MKKILTVTAAIIAIAGVMLLGASHYMLDFSLAPDPNRHNTDSAYTMLFARMSDMKPWMDSIKSNGLLRDTFVTMPSGERHHAIYMRSDSAKGRSAVVVHGYKDCCVKFLFLGRMYQRDLGFNILLPDLHGHGLSEGEDIQMGWKDRQDVRHWAEVAEEMFRDSTAPSKIVVHGVSMGAATTMCLAGEDNLPEYITCFVEDCGFSGVWDEFAMQLKELFYMPPFPLMYTTSALCQMKYGWTFGEASPVRQIAMCRRPMLFIHGDADTFVPFSMLATLYDAKPEPKQKWVAKGSEHARAYLDYPNEYTMQVKEFVDKYMGIKEN